MVWGAVKMLLEGAAAVASVSLVALYFMQNRLIYPSWAQGAREFVDTPDSYELPYELVTLTTGDGVRIQAFDIRNSRSDSGSTVVILCPNAGNMGYFISIADVFYRQLGMSVFIYSYRGYGHSEGTPSEKGLKLDADCVMEHLSRDPFHKARKLVLYGRSLGGANAIYIAAKFSSLCDAVILENTFLSIPKVIPYVFPALRYFSGMCHEIWDSEEMIKSCDSTLPFLFLSGLRDEIVPPSHMSKLYEICPSHNKQVFQFPLGYHNDTIIQEGYWSVVRNFLEEFALI